MIRGRGGSGRSMVLLLLLRLLPFVVVVVAGRLATMTTTASTTRNHPSSMFHSRSSSQTNSASSSNSNNSNTIEEYVAAKETQDSQPEATTIRMDNEEDENNGIQLKKQQQQHSPKKSNAVGDPDDDDDDDDDDDQDEEEGEQHASDLEQRNDHNNSLKKWQPEKEDDVAPHVQVELEFDHADENDSSVEMPEGGNHVGIMRSAKKKKEYTTAPSSGTKITDNTTTRKMDPLPILQAWKPYIYSPSNTLDFLYQHARQIDAASKLRLDRRTLYASLLLEWNHHRRHRRPTTTSIAAPSTPRRKFLQPGTTQSLQSSLSLATQPQWRRSFPKPNGIRLYNDNSSDSPTMTATTTTLAMQETLALALAHSFGCSMVVIDDDIIASVRQELASKLEDDVKPAILLQTLIQAANQGNLPIGTGRVSNSMKHDLEVGLDDPYDERAVSSCQDMIQWEEQAWSTDKGTDELSADSSSETSHKRSSPLILFLRAESSHALLKSKSVVETLLHECNSPDSVNLVVLGKGIDENTEILPDDGLEIPNNEMLEAPPTNSLQGAAPWFGFSPHNQNASGQNDPEGSKRFNIFLARTVDSSGTPGILGAIAPPQAGNLFPHMMAMQARERLQQQDEESPVKAELERWAQLLQQQMQTNGGSPLPPPQFFNASLSPSQDPMTPQNTRPPSPEVIQQTLQQAMSELLDRLANMNDESMGSGPDSLSPDLHKAFSQVLRNDNLRRGIAENLARAAPALSDPKCQGVMLSVYVPPPPNHINRGKLPNGQFDQQQQNMGGWFQKILNNQDQENITDDDEASRKNWRQKRTRTMAAAAAVLAAKKAQANKDSEGRDSKAERNLSRLESVCRPIAVEKPVDPVRGKSWESWVSRERGSVIFRQNRLALNQELEDHGMILQEHTGTVGAGSSLRQMLSVRDISHEMEDVIRCAIELEASKSLSKHRTPEEIHEDEMSLNVDITLNQLLMVGESIVEESSDSSVSTQYLHPSSLEAALTMVCRIAPSPAGGLTISGDSQPSHRNRDEIAALAQDKHERALISQVVLPQDIGVTYDMVGGLSEVKELLRQSITYPLKFPHLYSEGIAREAVKGVLLFGPPGTGKTMLAKAVATEGGASFLSVDASSVENKWLGESEKNAKAVFTLARRLAPCVVFIDEVDSLLSSREGTSDDSAHGTLTSVKTTMMSEWDGLNSGTNGSGEAGSDRVIVIGSTNRPFDLDEAVLRRFPRRILVDLPDLETRQEILEVTLAENRIDPSVNFTKIAEKLEGYTGSDIKEVCREAVVQISHEQAKMLDGGAVDVKEDITQGSLQKLRPVTNEDFEKALTKLKRSVSEKGRELQRVWEWNDEYGEIKKEKKDSLPHLANMYL